MGTLEPQVLVTESVAPGKLLACPCACYIWRSGESPGSPELQFFPQKDGAESHPHLTGLLEE